MAEDTEIFGVELDGRFQRLEKAMLQAANRTDANLNRIEKKFDATNKRLRRGLSFGGFDAGSQRAMRDAERQVQRLAGALAAAFSTREIVSMADEYTALQNRLQVVGLAGRQMADVQEHLFESATRNGVAVSALGELYGRVALSTKELGVGQADLLKFVDGVTASLRVQGTSTQAASGALLQLGQALGAGTVRAEELNSILEGVPVIAQAAARGMGVSVASLRKSVLDGKVSSQAFFAALMKGFPQVEKQAQGSALTIGQGMAGLRNEFIKYIGKTDDAVNASGRAAKAIQGIAQNLDTIMPILTAVAGFFGVRYVASLGAATLAQGGFVAKGWAAARDMVAQEREKTAAVVVGTRARVAALTAEAAALSAQVQTGRNATGQFISRAAAQQQLSATNSLLASSSNAATAATIRSSGAMTAAAGGAKALGSGLLALAGGPVGLAVTAIAALTIGLIALAQHTSDAAIAARAQAQAYQAVQPATTELEKLVRKLATANDEETASIRRKIAAILDEQRLKAQMARNDYLDAKAKERERNVTRDQIRANPVFSVGAIPAGGLQFEGGSRPGGIGPNGNPIDTVKDTTELRRLRAEAEAAEEAFDRLKSIAEEGTAAAATAARAASSGGKADKGEARRAEQRARMLEDLKAQTALEVAQLDQQAALVRELERSAEITARIRSLKDAGVRAAEAERISAEAQAQLDQARARAREREEAQLIRNWDLDIARVDENWASVRAIEEEIERRELVAALAKVSTDQASAEAKATSILASIQSARADAARRALEITREEHRLQVAQLSGNRALTKELQDQAAIRERTARYQQDGRLGRAEAERRATAEVTQERAAATYGEQRELFATAFSDGIRAALSGDLQGFLSNQFGNFADIMFKRAGEQMYDAMFGGVSAATEGAAQGAAIAATVTPAIATAGAAAAGAMGSAITAAGAAAGASMAAAITAANAARIPFLPGFDKGGYTGAGGVREPAGVVHRGEVVWSQRDVARSGGVAAVEAMRKGLRGYASGGAVGRSVIPQANAAAARVQATGRAVQQPVIVRLAVEEGSLFVPRVEAISGSVAVQAASASAAYSQEQSRSASARRSQSLIG